MDVASGIPIEYKNIYRIEIHASAKYNIYNIMVIVPDILISIHRLRRRVKLQQTTTAAVHFCYIK